jgi:regulator of replication initiation timing
MDNVNNIINYIVSLENRITDLQKNVSSLKQTTEELSRKNEYLENKIIQLQTTQQPNAYSDSYFEASLKQLIDWKNDPPSWCTSAYQKRNPQKSAKEPEHMIYWEGWAPDGTYYVEEYKKAPLATDWHAHVQRPNSLQIQVDLAQQRLDSLPEWAQNLCYWEGNHPF